MDKIALKTLLQDPQVDERLKAARSLSQLNCFVPELFELALGDEDWRVRKETVAGFMLLPVADSHAAFVVDLLNHPENAGLRNAAIEILIGLGAQVVETLLARLATGDAEVRKFIVDILGEIGQSTCASELLPYLQDEDLNVRYAVVETLGKLRSVTAVDALLDLLEAADAGLQFTIFEALASIGAGVPVDRILPYAQNALLRKSVFSCLGQLGNGAGIPVLLKGLSDPLSRNRHVALLAFAQLIRTLPEHDCPQVDPQSAQVVDWLIELLAHENLDYRRAACYVLSLFPDARIVNSVLALLAEEELRADVVAVGRMIPKVILTTLVASSSLADENALYLIFLFGELGYPEIGPLALSGLASEDPQFRYASAMTLGKVGAVESMALLSDALADEIPEIRDAASESLVLIGRSDPAALIRTVAPYLESAEIGLRLIAVRTLSALPTKLVENYLLLALKDVAPEVRCEALRGLTGHQSSRLLSGLSLALTDEETDVRRLAATAIGTFPEVRATPLLEHALDDSDPWVRMAAIRALKSGDVAVLNAILTRAAADPVGLVVIAALEMAPVLAPDSAADLLRTALGHEDEEVVRTAVHLLLADSNEPPLLEHDRQLVRLLAIDQLQRLAPQLWLPLFEEGLAGESDSQVRQALEAALRKGGTGE